MSDAELEWAVGRILALLDATRAIDAYRAYRPGAIMRSELTRLRRRLMGEFGRRRGWTWNQGPQPVQSLHHLRAPPGHWEVPRHTERPSHYRIGRHPVALSYEPYLNIGKRFEMNAWCRERDLTLEFPDFPSPWDPGKTTLVIVRRTVAMKR